MTRHRENFLFPGPQLLLEFSIRTRFMPSTLYDDLGVAANASPEEIRDAHRRMAKLLHPDYCQDLQTRKLAEAHMKRVNAAFAILSDPAQRLQYDLALQQPPAGLPRPLLRQVPRWAWTAAGVAALLTAVFLAPSKESSGPAPPVPKALPPAAPPVQAKPKPAARTPEPTPPARPRKAAAVLPPAMLPPPRPVRREFVPPPSIAVSVPTLDAPPAAVSAPAIEPPRETLAGAWIYIKPAVPAAAANTYPPEFIELTVYEEGSLVKGRYNARYRVANLAISPDVRFTFENGVWKGNGGASGEIELNLLSPDRLYVSWVTTAPGSHPALGSGSAILIRRRLP
jgi:hypothetical protein